ncbi:MAG: sigma-54 dependent transcriptional regulator [Proteobacteria bacterium]|nr:sigma-54 dependent transcriptional regulator [Cystobacterineae bacterium]MCL2259112.1 sigma-54 dependent transcriptional regulator [Cystobacterineae bacterium]MCL2314514.1 sigma-54 dependent transcriptional regulator [Pseudomonadota bacterium]
MFHILVVDDEANLRKVLATILRKQGYEVSLAAHGEEALALVQKSKVDVIVTDLVMPKLGGMELLKTLAQTHPEIPIIMITAHGTVDSAVEAIKRGAFDYITKPFEQSEIQSVVEKAAKTVQANKKNVHADWLRSRSAIIGNSPQMQEVFRLIDKVANTPSTVLITGESGTGKELVATALHQGSSRHPQPLIKINCAAIPKDLMESELFGYERGAFTGAVNSKPGRFELAEGGTLFLDEISEIPVEMQVKLLRALQECAFERVGGIKTTRVDVRLVAASNRNLEKEVETGRFRKDLFYRLNVVPIHLPSLRERKDDIPSLVNHFIEKYNHRLHKNVENLSLEALSMLQNWPWPGNIRELENLMERVLVLTEATQLSLADFPENMRSPPPSSPLPVDEITLVPQLKDASFKDIVRMKSAEVERELIAQALEETKGNVTRTAKLLQISRKSLQTKMKELGLRDENNEDT